MGESELGAKSSTTCTSADGSSARLDVRVSWHCGPRDAESCEATVYRGTLTVHSGGRSETVKVKADCGC